MFLRGIEGNPLANVPHSSYLTASANCSIGFGKLSEGISNLVIDTLCAIYKGLAAPCEDLASFKIIAFANNL
jgi:hypothetical protein